MPRAGCGGGHPFSSLLLACQLPLVLQGLSQSDLPLSLLSSDTPNGGAAELAGPRAVRLRSTGTALHMPDCAGRAALSLHSPSWRAAGAREVLSKPLSHKSAK